MNGTDWLVALKPLSRPARMDAVYAAVVANAAVRWPMSKVSVSAGGLEGYLLCADDYVSLGTPDDFVRVPLDAPTAQKVANHLGMLLPTTKLVDIIYRAAAVKLQPMPMIPQEGFPYDQTMLTVDRFGIHNGWIELGHSGAAGRSGRTGLIAGHKKDVVVTNRLLKQPRQVPIYGWQQLNGKPIQPLSLVHEGTYADYAHGARMIAPVIRIGDVDVSLEEVMMDPERCHLVVDVLATVDGGPLTLQTTRLAIGPTPPYAKPTPATGTPVPAPSSPPPPAIVRGTGDWPGIKFQQAEQYKAIAAGRKVDLVVLHTGELPEKPTGAEAVANYFSRPRDANGNVVTASSHFVHDDDSTVQCVLEKDIAYAAPGANNNGIQIEHAGYARQTAAEWADDYSTRELTISAQLTAKLCAKYAIPPNYVDDLGLLAGARGITTHVSVSKAFKRSTHTDPGPNFPMERYLELVRQFMETT